MPPPLSQDHSDAAGDAVILHRKPAATIYDIARATGVNPSTVSRALNKPGRVNVNTEKRIRDVATTLGYHLNPMARALPTGRTGALGLLLSDITNPVYFDLIRGAENLAAAEGFTMILAESQESPEQEFAAVQRLQPAVDGLVLVGSRLSDDEIRELSAAKPLVIVNRVIDNVLSVVPDVDPGVDGLLNHLQSCGHRSLGFVSGPTTSWMNRARWNSMFSQAVARGLSIVELGSSAPTRDGGTAMLPRVKASGVTAAIAYNDLMAMGLLRACRDDGITVPDDLSIAGFDDIFGSDLTSPALTTVRSPMKDLGDAAIRSLLAEINGESADRSQALPTSIVVRESTSVPR